MSPRKEIIGDCSGVPVAFCGLEPVVIIYIVHPKGGGDPVYVGSTTQQLRTRIRGHVIVAKRGSPLPFHRWIMSHLDGFSVAIAEICNPSERADRERYWVAKYSGLLNQTDGGPGGSGAVWPADRREKMAKAIRSGDWFSCRMCEAKFWRKQKEIVRGHNKFCSRECYQASLRGVSRPLPEHVMQRGVAAAAKQRRARTHCTNGHQFDAQNTRINKNGARVCRTCERMHKRTYAEKAVQHV